MYIVFNTMLPHMKNSVKWFGLKFYMLIALHFKKLCATISMQGVIYLKYNKEKLTEIFAGGSERIKQYHLPTWDELPKIELYMDQVIVLLSDYLEIFSAVSHDDKLVTPTMINNYVKLKIIPAPVKKRYSKVHLAYLVMVCILKQTLAISMISKIIPPDLTEEELKAVYTSFVKNQAKSFNYVTEQINAVAEPILNLTENNQDRLNDLVLQVAISANIFKLITSLIAQIQEDSTEKK